MLFDPERRDPCRGVNNPWSILADFATHAKSGHGLLIGWLVRWSLPFAEKVQWYRLVASRRNNLHVSNVPLRIVNLRAQLIPTG